MGPGAAWWCAPRCWSPTWGALQAGRENAQAWVTTLDKGRWWPAPGCRCPTARAVCWPRPSNAQGLVDFGRLPPQPGAGGAPRGADAEARASGQAYFVSARAARPTGWKTWPSPGATGTAASSPGASTCPPARSTPRPARPHRVRPHAAARRRDRVHEALLRTETARAWACRAQPDTCSSPTWAAASSTPAAALAQDGHRRAQRRERVRHPAGGQAGRVRRSLDGQQAGSSASRSSACRCCRARSRRWAGPLVRRQPAGAGAGQLRGGRAGGPAAGARVGPGAPNPAFADYEAFSFSPPRGPQAAASRRRGAAEAARTSAWWPTSCR
jgi:hypothetical protein